MAQEGIEALLDEWEQLARQWSAAVAVRKGNRLIEEAFAVARELRDSPAGRVGIERRLNDPDRGVVMLAASASLAWDSEDGIRTLERMIRDGGDRSFNAKITLREYREGRLGFDWWPSR